MRIQVNAVHFTADQRLLDFIQRKLDKLETFHDRILSAEVFLRLDGSDSSRVKQKVFEVKLYMAGDSMFISERAKTFEEAVDVVIDRFKNQLVRHKDKQRSLSKSEIKETRLVEEPVGEDVDY
ncbi:ribosome hibernation-promoting factor, HPF/YfiA family [Tellurirhabdus rosea]|uniref:ribosome hibernation-promoting factor, HPF/YfiA family n=1 Tax=Tellurirhabdus rosea TaxID=2674997 RepID=UPI0022529993|nr:ribosome-associated translation inhibitor RaiA [Tellurirhabdus rosea]